VSSYGLAGFTNQANQGNQANQANQGSDNKQRIQISKYQGNGLCEKPRGKIYETKF